MKMDITGFWKPKHLQFLLAALTIACIARALKPISNYRLTQWLFNYDNGFLKRGLPGSILGWLDIAITKDNLNFVSYALFVLVVSVFLFVFIRLYKSSGHATWAFTFMILALINPGTLQHFAHDMGRFDGIGLIIFIVALMAIEKLHPYISLTLSIACSAIMLLTHEAFFFVYIPPILAFWIYLSPQRTKWIFGSGAFALILIATYFVSSYGVLKTDAEFDLLIAEKQQQVGAWADPVSLKVVRAGSLKENFDLTVKNTLSTDKAIDHLKLFVLLLLPIYQIFSGFIKRLITVLPKKRSEIVMLFLSILSSLALYPLGYDHFRWWALAITNFFILVAFTARMDKKVQNLLSEQIQNRKNVIITLLILSVLLGPLSTYYAFQ